jgi:hypothetical protein
VALLAALEAELVEKSADHGLAVGEVLGWSAGEAAVLEMIADTVDRKADLSEQYRAAADDPRLRIKLSGELRLLESNVARLLKQIKTELPPAPSPTSQKAKRAADTRWGSNA